MTVSSPQKISFEAELEIAKEGFRFAKRYHDNWFEGVNRCPYGPAYPHPRPRNVRAEAWYRGWWFYHYTIKHLSTIFSFPQKNLGEAKAKTLTEASSNVVASEKIEVSRN